MGPEEDFILHFNRYSYALNNPVRYTDPDGRKSSEDTKPDPIYLNKSELPPITRESVFSQDGNNDTYIGYSYKERLEFLGETTVRGKTEEVNTEGIPLNLGVLYDAIKDAKKTSGVGIVIDAATPDLKIMRTPIYNAEVHRIYYRLVQPTLKNGAVQKSVEIPNEYYKTMEIKITPETEKLLRYEYSIDWEY